MNGRVIMSTKNSSMGAGKPSKTSATRVGSLRALLAEAGRLASVGTSQEEIIEWITGVGAAAGLRVHHDLHDWHLREVAPTVALDVAAPTTAAVLDVAPTQPVAATTPGRRKKKNGPKPIVVMPPATRSRDGKHQLSLVDLFRCGASTVPAAVEADANRGGTVCRLVFGCDKQGSGLVRGRGKTFYDQSVGVVIDAHTWRVLAAPPGIFAANVASAPIDQYLERGLYDVIRVDDGTVVTLYSWTHPTKGIVWGLATSNAYDVSPLKWSGPLTYAEIFHDLASRLYPEFVRESGLRLVDSQTLDFPNLDPKRCYTIGFRHHNFHPMRIDPERMWLIHCADLGDDEPNILYGSRLYDVPSHTLCAFPEKVTVAFLRGRVNGSLAEAAAYLAGDCQNDLREPCLNYGYILRSRDRAVTGVLSDILVESPLLIHVRKLAYERAPRAVRDHITEGERQEYNAWRAYLTPRSREIYLGIFPDWADRFAEFGVFVDGVVSQAVHIVRQRAMASPPAPPKTATGQIAAALLEHILACEKQLPEFSKDIDSIIRDYAVNSQHALIYLRGLNARSKKVGADEPAQ